MRAGGCLSLPKIALALVLTGQQAGAGEAPVPRVSQGKHLGVAACSSTVCHGEIAPKSGSDVALNEYVIWKKQDKHAEAYRVLTGKAARQIGEKLGVGEPTRAKICLDCHTDNVSSSRRDFKFQIDEGVTCESCHGGGEDWIKSHSSPTVSHADNIAAGMYPTEQPLARARLCLGCHLGTKDQFAAHSIMAAGHPRLIFELDAFSTNQPAHFKVDDDYVRRKGRLDRANLWLVGQLESARQMLELLQSPLLQPEGVLYPELALYDCSGCHHSFEQPRWTRQRVSAGTGPGTPRLQTQNLVTLQAALQVLDPKVAGELKSKTDALVQAGNHDLASIRRAAAATLQVLDGLTSEAERKLSRDDVVAIRRSLLKLAAEEQAADYVAAQQVELAVESLSYRLDDQGSKRSSLDALFKTLKSDASYNPSQFSAAAKTALPKF
jgi:hypothetical protein